MTECRYRIDYTIMGRGPDDEDFKEIGFGSSGDWEGVDAAAYAMQSDIDNRQWETRPDHPDPKEAV